MSISGINGTNCILMSFAKVRVESKIITQAEISGKRGRYTVSFTNTEAKWDGKAIVLSSSRSPFEAKIFKTIDGAMSDIKQAGINSATIKIKDEK
jgi:hypothetical protein